MKLSHIIPAAAMTLAACSAALPAGAHTAGDPLPTITVSASSDVTTAPDVASVSAGVVTRGLDAGDAMAQNAALMNKVYAQLTSAGIERKYIQTSQLSLQPQYDYKDRSAPRITGYEARNTVSARTFDLDNVGPMIDALVKAGVNNINNVQFGVRDPKAAQAIAREAAIKEARAKARSMATAAGVRLGPLQSLSESNYNPQPRPVMMQRSMAMAADATPVSGGEQSISVTVNMVYGIAQ